MTAAPIGCQPPFGRRGVSWGIILFIGIRNQRIVFERHPAWLPWFPRSYLLVTGPPLAHAVGVIPMQWLGLLACAVRPE
jgi:hypothetical protein